MLTIRKKRNGTLVVMEDPPEEAREAVADLGFTVEPGGNVPTTDEPTARALSCYLRILRDARGWTADTGGDEQDVDTSRPLSDIAPKVVKQTVKAYRDAMVEERGLNVETLNREQNLEAILGGLSEVEPKAAPSRALEKWDAIEEASEDWSMEKFNDWSSVARFIRDNQRKFGSGAAVVG
jgi:hypothetical protein